MIDADEEIALAQLSMHSPLGDLTVSAEGDTIVALDWGWGRDQEPTAVLREAVRQIDEYLDGARVAFALPLDPAGTPYRQRVWRLLSRIPFGETRSYGAVAAMAGGCARAVGQAMRSNPIPLLIPCHRVVGATGLGGYSGGDGIEHKRYLLQHETSFAPPAT